MADNGGIGGLGGGGSVSVVGDSGGVGVCIGFLASTTRTEGLLLQFWAPQN